MPAACPQLLVCLRTQRLAPPSPPPPLPRPPASPPLSGLPLPLRRCLGWLPAPWTLHLPTGSGLSPTAVASPPPLLVVFMRKPAHSFVPASRLPRLLHARALAPSGRLCCPSCTALIPRNFHGLPLGMTPRPPSRALSCSALLPPPPWGPPTPLPLHHPQLALLQFPRPPSQSAGSPCPPRAPPLPRALPMVPYCTLHMASCAA